MSAANYDFPIEQGTSYRLTFIYKDSDGNAINITNWCARLVMKTAYKDIAKKNLSSTIIYSSTNSDYSQYKFYIDGTQGKVTLLFPAGTTNNFDFDTAKYDIELQSPEDFYTSGGNYTMRILYGTITVVKRNSGSIVALNCNT
jgi:hypothetical protein